MWLLKSAGLPHNNFFKYYNIINSFVPIAVKVIFISFWLRLRHHVTQTDRNSPAMVWKLKIYFKHYHWKRPISCNTLLSTASLFSQIIVAASELELSTKRERGGRGRGRRIVCPPPTPTTSRSVLAVSVKKIGGCEQSTSSNTLLLTFWSWLCRFLCLKTKKGKKKQISNTQAHYSGIPAHMLVYIPVLVSKIFQNSIWMSESVHAVHRFPFHSHFVWVSCLWSIEVKMKVTYMCCIVMIFSVYIQM